MAYNRHVLKTAIFLTALCSVAASQAAQPIIDNERVTVFDETSPMQKLMHDYVVVYLSGHRKGEASLGKGGTVPNMDGAHCVVVELKDHPVDPLPNKSGYPNAFPRPHVKKLYETDKVLVWSYRWNPGEPTPMHFHDKDVVVVYQEPTALRSTTPDGKETINEYKEGEVRFNLRDRTHTETLIRGAGSAVMTELK
jgi:hypothetical protein